MDRDVKRLYAYMLSDYQPKHRIVRTEPTVIVRSQPANIYSIGGSVTDSGLLDSTETIKYRGVMVYTERIGNPRGPTQYRWPPCKLFPRRAMDDQRD